MLTALEELARQLTTKGLESGEELKPAGTNGSLLCMLHTGMLPEQNSWSWSVASSEVRPATEGWVMPMSMPSSSEGQLYAKGGASSAG